MPCALFNVQLHFVHIVFILTLWARSFEHYAPWTLYTLCLVIWAGDVVANGVVRSRQRVIAWCLHILCRKIQVLAYVAQSACIYCTECLHILHRVLAYIAQKDTSACIYCTECLHILHRKIKVLAYIVQSVCLYCTECLLTLHRNIRVFAYIYIAQRKLCGCMYRIEKN